MKVDRSKELMWNILSAPYKRYDPWEDPTVMTVDVFFKPVMPVEYIKLDLVINKNED